MAIVSIQTQITVTRKTSYADRLRAYKVVIDGEAVGAVRARKSVTIPVAPGKHSLEIRIDWCGSERIDFEVRSGEHVLFECGSNLTGWRVLLAFSSIGSRADQYLWLRRTN